MDAAVRARRAGIGRGVDAADRDAVVEDCQGLEIDPDLQRRLVDCLRRISVVNRRYGRTLILHAQGYETEEVCRRIGLKESTFYSLLHRGRAMLQRCLDTGEVS